jgi:hypothetical protein
MSSVGTPTFVSYLSNCLSGFVGALWEGVFHESRLMLSETKIATREDPMRVLIQHCYDLFMLMRIV